MTVVNSQYRATDMIIPAAGKLELVWTPDDGSAPVAREVFHFKEAGATLAMYNTKKVSISHHSPC